MCQQLLAQLFIRTWKPYKVLDLQIGSANPENEAAEANAKRMRKFDPWPVFFKREWNRNWPFLVGFAITGAVITKFSLGLTEEDAKNSKFVKAHKR
ncbi:hypothetical protein VNO78_05565 [Psophocarpus tetragonolobus]|uniref:Mitochondrial ATP synthase 6 kDa subunit n=1 Tax=Psophocarpus tetragonolobus TaxID=3891 RepID=A0AAN9SRZ5_PSOTE